MEVKQYIPHPSLQQYVLSLATVHFVLPGAMSVATPYPPTPFNSLIFYCNHPVAMSRTGGFETQPDTVLIGPQFSRVNIRVATQLRAIRVDFLPGGMYRMLGIPMHRLFDSGFDACEIFGASMRRLNEQLKNTEDLEQCKHLVETFLLQQAGSVRDRLPFDDAILSLMKHDGNLAIDTVASLSCLSLKQFERKCKERIGMNPKTYARILKFSKAYRMHESFPHLSWTHIAHSAGYYDQMHMIRDFKVFAGVNPSVIEHELGATPLRMQKDLKA